ncbi:hypothetical protein MASR2M66_24700 [Chloroflexota bacterium]
MPLPEKIGRYKIESELGRGGMATVYRAFDPSFDREVAIKVLPREMMHDPHFRSRFEREIKMIASLEHPSIVPVYDVGDDDGQPFFVMRFMNGGSLSNIIEKGSVSLQDTARIVEKIAQGLAHAHRKGIIHRDLKPDNILFDETGEPFISDFGVAKLSESASNLTGSGVIGTPAYMSPEQAQGIEIDQRSDVYGLGVIVYQMLTGRQPYSADTPMGVVIKHITEPVPEILKILPAIKPEIDAIIKTAMAKDKTQRYANTIELAKALNVAAFGETGNLTYSSSTGILPRLKNNTTQLSRKQTTGLAVTGIVIIIALIGLFLLGRQLFASDEPAATESQTASTSVPTKSTGTSGFAPACSANVTLPVPEVKETNSICAKKSPYVNLTIPEGAEFKALTADSSCKVSATSGGKDVITCTGPNFVLIEIQVCQRPELTNEQTAQCAADSTYNVGGACCMTVAPEDAGCVVQQVQLKGCQ